MCDSLRIARSYANQNAGAKRSTCFLFGRCNGWDQRTSGRLSGRQFALLSRSGLLKSLVFAFEPRVFGFLSLRAAESKECRPEDNKPNTHDDFVVSSLLIP